MILFHVWPVGQAVKTPPFHGGNMGSIPIRVIYKRSYENEILFLKKIEEILQNIPSFFKKPYLPTWLNSSKIKI